MFQRVSCPFPQVHCLLKYLYILTHAEMLFKHLGNVQLPILRLWNRYFIVSLFVETRLFPLIHFSFHHFFSAFMSCLLRFSMFSCSDCHFQYNWFGSRVMIFLYFQSITLKNWSIVIISSFSLCITNKSLKTTFKSTSLGKCTMVLETVLSTRLVILSL